MSTEWYLQKTKYYSGYELEEIEETYDVFDELLTQSPEAYNVTVNENPDLIRIIVQSTSKYNERRILFRKDDIHWGDLVIHEGEKWLVTERPLFNKIHEKSKMELCNTEMVFTYFTEGVYEVDPLGNKIWIEEPSEVVEEIPCVLSSISDLNTKITFGHEVNIPKGDIVLTISYNTNKLLYITSEFELLGDEYKITGIDKSKVHRGQGVLILIASKTSK